MDLTQWNATVNAADAIATSASVGDEVIPPSYDIGTPKANTFRPVIGIARVSVWFATRLRCRQRHLRRAGQVRDQRADLGLRKRLPEVFGHHRLLAGSPLLDLVLGKVIVSLAVTRVIASLSSARMIPVSTRPSVVAMTWAR